MVKHHNVSMRKGRILSFLTLACGTMTVFTSTGLSETAEETYSAVLLKAIEPHHYAFSNDPGFTWLQSAGLNPLSGIIFDYSPLEGFRDPNAVPWLVNVALNGPSGSQWHSEVMIRRCGGFAVHLARCAATLNLGLLRDQRAYEPLVYLLQHGNMLEQEYEVRFKPKEKYDIRAHAAQALGYLGDRRAVGLLLAVVHDEQNTERVRSAVYGLGFLGDSRATRTIIGLMEDKNQSVYMRKTCFESLARMRDMTALPNMIQAARDLELGYQGHDWFRFMTRTTFVISLRGRDRNLIVESMPELGMTKDYMKIWEHWLKTGKSKVAADFSARHQEWKQSRQTHANNSQVQIRRKNEMRGLGIAALPHIMDAIDHGDTELIGLIPDVIGRCDEIDEKATREQVLEWWNKNKKRWTIPFE